VVALVAFVGLVLISAPDAGCFWKLPYLDQ
jgi:hypothetical protein